MHAVPKDGTVVEWPWPGSTVGDLLSSPSNGLAGLDRTHAFQLRRHGFTFLLYRLVHPDEEGTSLGTARSSLPDAFEPVALALG